MLKKTMKFLFKKIWQQILFWNLFFAKMKLRVKARKSKQKQTIEISSSPELIYSLASVKERFSEIHFTIQSLLQQSLKPSKICIYLHKSIRPQFPKKIESIPEVEILSGEEKFSSSKLMPAREKYPNHTIITIDDDILYPKWHLEKLHQEHLKNPQDIICYQARIITQNINQEVKMSYASCIDTMENLNIWRKPPILKGDLIFPIGARGILYPPDSLDIKFLQYLRANSDFCYKDSDISFYFAARKKKTQHRLFPILPLQAKFCFQALKSSEKSACSASYGTNREEIISEIYHETLSIYEKL